MNHVTRAVFKRDLRSWFGNPIGYVFITLFVFLSAFALVGPTAFFHNSLASLDTLNEWYRVLLLFFIPAVTMGVWAGERSWGTHELLFTLPAKDSHILLGKFLAAAGVFTIALLFTLPLPLGLEWLGDPDWGLLLSNYLGYWLLGLTLISVAMVGSQLTENLTVSFILGAMLCALMVFADDILRGMFPGLGAALAAYSPNALFQEMGRGVVSAGSILLFGGFIVAFLYLNLALLSRRSWKGGAGEALHPAVRFASLVVVAVALSVIGLNSMSPVDATAERIHSLSDDTVTLLDDLDPERPVYIQAFVSKEVPREYVQTRRTLLNLLNQYDAMGGSAIQLRVVPTARYSEAAREAEANFEITHQTALTEEGSRVRTFDVFMGLAFQCGTEEVVIPFMERAMPVEYEITRSIRVVASAQRRKIGVLKTDVDMFGGWDFQTMRQRPEWEIVRELKLQYEVESVDPAADYPDDLDALLVPMVSSLTQEQMDRLNTYIRTGAPTMLVDDPFPSSAPGTSASDPKGGPRNPLTSQGQPPPEQKGDVNTFLRGLGIEYDHGSIVYDLFNPHPELELAGPEIVFVRQGSGTLNPFNPDEKITSGLQEIVAIFGGRVMEARRDPDLAFVPLLKTGSNSGTLSKQDAFTWSPFGGQSLNPYRRYNRDLGEKALAARVHGKLDEETQINVIFCADLDIIGSMFFQIRRQGLGESKIQFDNVTFALNCIDELAGDDSFIELRKRRPVHRTLTTIEQQQMIYNNQWLTEKEEAEAKAASELADAQKRLDDRVAELSNDTALDERSREIQIQTIRDVEQRKLDLAKAKIEDAKAEAIELAKAKKLEQQYSIQRRYTTVTLAGSPIPALAVALFMFSRRRRREREAVPGTRIAKGAA